MGIEGLLPLLKSIMRRAHISEFAGQTAAVDVSPWLYKGAYSCAWELGQGIDTYGYLSFPLKLVNLLLRHGIKPLLVFDGLAVPLKERTLSKRKEDKAKHKAKAEQLAKEGKTEDAAVLFARAISIKNDMLHLFMDVLNSLHVSYIVAPYEADAQIAYLWREKMCDFVISEDSDLLVYGCSSVVFKLDIEGNCEHLAIDSTMRNEEYLKSVRDDCVKALGMLSPDRFMELCVVSGCDYLPNIPGFGIKKALHYLRDYTLAETLGKIQYKKQFMGKIPPSYLEAVKNVKMQFTHGTVIDPRTFTVTQLAPLTEPADWLGKPFDPAIVAKYTQGLYDIKANSERLRLSNEDIDQKLRAMATSNRDKVYMDNQVRHSHSKPESKHPLKDINKKPDPTPSAKGTALPPSSPHKTEDPPKPVEPDIESAREDAENSAVAQEEVKTPRSQASELIQREIDLLVQQTTQEAERATAAAAATASKAEEKPKAKVVFNPFAKENIGSEPKLPPAPLKRKFNDSAPSEVITKYFQPSAKKPKPEPTPALAAVPQP